MISMTLGQIAQCVRGTLAQPGKCEKIAATAVTIDNRTISGGELFVAIAGARVDGNSFAQVALEAGAVGVLTADLDAALASGADPQRLIVVDEPIHALGLLAHHQVELLYRHGQKNFTVVGVTGSVGKTTTKDLLAHLLASRGPVVAPPGSFNNELGLPLTVLRATAETATLVLEMGADNRGNIEYLTDIVHPDISVVLAVARAHLGEFGSIENVALAKTELVLGTRAGGVVVLNYDDERVRNMARHAPGEVVYFSASGQYTAGVWASDISADATGHASFVLHYGEQQAPVRLGLIGMHHVTNALAAASVAVVSGLSLADCAQSLSNTVADSPHRMNVWQAHGVTVIDDSYNANPDSMRAGLAALAHIGAQHRTIAILGTMLELGETSQAEHRAIGDYLVERGIDVLIAVGSELAVAAQQARAGGVTTYNVHDISEVRPILDTLITDGDTVLLKGSNGSRVWQLADELLKEKDR